MRIIKNNVDDLNFHELIFDSYIVEFKLTLFDLFVDKRNFTQLG